MRSTRVLPTIAIILLFGFPALGLAGPTCPLTIDEISDVQASVDVLSPTGASLCDGESVALDGIVYAVFPDVPAFAFADDSGPWNGLYAFSGAVPLPEVGDDVTVSGTIDEFFGVTEVVVSGTVVHTSGNTPYSPTSVSTLTIATGQTTAEAYEGVFVEVAAVEITDADLGFGEFAVDDGSGATRVDDLGPYCYRAAEGVVLDVVRGMLHYSFDNFKIEPRTDCDFLTGGCGVATMQSISAIQGTGFVSPMAGQLVETSGEVVGLFEGNYPGFQFFDGFFLQDPVGDGQAATSDGVFVISDTVPTVGDLLSVTGFVSEFGEFDGTNCTDGCVTMICSIELGLPGPRTAGGITPGTWSPPSDADGLYEYHESKEGMLMTIPGSANVVGPTNFGAVFVVDDALGVDRVLRASPEQGKQVGVRNWEALGDIGGSDPDDLIVGSVIESVTGPLTVSFGDPLIITQASGPWSTVSSEPLPASTPAWSAAEGERFSVATLNVHNLDAGDTTGVAKLVETVTAMGCPAFLALQEVDTISTISGDEDEVVSAILSGLAGEGCDYSFTSTHPDRGDHGVVALWLTDRFTGATASNLQGCSVNGSPSSIDYDDFCDAFPGEFPLFSRRPIVVEATLDTTCGTGSSPLEVTFIVNHFKSQLGGAPSDQRRLEQAQLVASTVDGLLAGGTDHVLVLGDLNDFEDSPTLLALTDTGPLDNLWSEVAEADRYSYIFSGVSQVLDHQLATPELGNELLAVAPLHFNADYPSFAYGSDAGTPWALSDHDPMAATFSACAGALIFADGFESGDTTAW